MSRDILCTICARGGSKGVKNKNIRLLHGKPLIAYSIETALSTGLFAHVVVSTDSDAIADAAKQFGAEVFFKRPSELAGDSAAKIPVIRHALISSEAHFGQRFDSLVDLDATSPLRTPEDIRGAWDLFINGGWDNIITATPARKSPYFNLIEQDKNGRVFISKSLVTPVVRRQDSPPCFDMNASIYIWKRESLLHNDRVVHDKSGLYVMPEERSIDIDNEIDFDFVEFIMGRRLTNEHAGR